MSFIIGQSRPRYLASSVKIFKAMTIAPAAARAEVYDAFVDVMTESGLWAKCDLIYALAAHAEQASLINLKNPGTFNLTKSGTPTFTADQGWTGNGTDGHLLSGFTPSSAGGVFLQNSAHLSCWIRTTAVEAVPDVSANEALLRIDSNRTGPSGLVRVNDGTNLSLSPTLSTGFFIAKRTASNEKAYRVNGGVDSASAATAATGAANGQFRILGGTSSFCTKQLSFVSLGAGMTDAEADDTFYPAVQALLAGIGAI